MHQIKYSIKEIVEILKKRQENKFDANFAISGNRGLGKSTLAGKIFYRFANFNPWKHQVYSRNDVLQLLQNEKYGACWDDEAINTSYKREFQNKSQQELIKTVTMYRDNFNVYASTIPNFFSLDKDLRDLYFMHVNIVRRGIAVIHMASEGRLYSLDKWDTKNNQKTEEKWARIMKKKPTFHIPYHKLSTFIGYLYFEDMTPKQRDLYEEIKQTKRAKATQDARDQSGEVVISFSDKLYKLLLEGNLSSDGLLQACLMEGKKYSVMVSFLNQMLKDNGKIGTLKEYLLVKGVPNVHTNHTDQITPSIPSY